MFYSVCKNILIKIGGFLHWDKLFIIFPFALGVIVYANTLSYGFVYDDIVFHDVVEYRSVTTIPKAFLMPFESKNRISGLYRPISIISFILNFVFFGESPFSFHVINILLHAIICLLIYVLLAKVFKFNAVISVVSAILFAVLPIHSEVIANIKSRDELLAALFLFSCGWRMNKGGKRPIGSY